MTPELVFYRRKDETIHAMTLLTLRLKDKPFSPGNRAAGKFSLAHLHQDA
jgi:hypothetical protein